MTYEDAKNRLNACIKYGFLCRGCEFEHDCSIEKVHEMAIEALEKQIPKKPMNKGKTFDEQNKTVKNLLKIIHAIRLGEIDANDITNYICRKCSLRNEDGVCPFDDDDGKCEQTEDEEVELFMDWLFESTRSAEK